MKRNLASMSYLFLWLVLITPARADELRLDEIASGQSASQHLTYWRDESGQADISTARAADQAGRFLPTNGRISFGIDKTPHWFRLDLYPPSATSTTWWIELAHPSLDDVQVYVPAASGYLKQYEVGDHQIFSSRPLLHRYFIFPVSLTGSQTSTLYFRVQTNDTLTIPLRVWNPTRFDVAAGYDDILVGGYVGVILAMLIYNFFFYLKLRDRLYLQYVLFSISCLLVVTELNGLNFQFLFPDNLWWADHQHFIFPIFALCMTLLFTLRFLELKSTNRWMGRIVRVQIAGLILIGIIDAAVDYSLGQQLILIMSPIVMISVLVAGIIRIRQGYRPAKYFVAAQIPLSAGEIYVCLSGTGLWSTDLLIQQAMGMGSAFEVLLFSLALADRISILRAQKIEAESKLRIRAQLADLEQESRSMIEYNPDSIARYDQNVRRIYVNPAFASMAEGGAAALLGKSPSESPGGKLAVAYETAVKKVFATGENSEVEFEWIGKNGRTVYSQIRMAAEYDSSGAIKSVLAVGRDISVLKKAEMTEKMLTRTITLQSKSGSALVHAKSEQELLNEICQLAVESGGYLMAWVGFAEFDAAKTVRPVAQSGYEEGYLDHINISWAENESGLGPTGTAIRTGTTVALNDIQASTSMRLWREAAIQRGYRSCIALPLMIDGRAIGSLTIYSVEPEAFGGESVKLLEALANDLAYGILTLRVRAERDAAEQALKKSIRKLEEKELAKTRFLAAAGHDLRQPLAAANLFIDALKVAKSPADLKQIFQRLDQSMETFNELLDALLNVSKLDAGMIKPEFAPINVAELFVWLEQNYSPLAFEKKIGFHLYFPMNERLVVDTDIGLLNSVMMNLISNAIKFTHNGAVLVSARRRGGNVLFQVWDTGIGIVEENIPYIFDEFYQVNNPQRDRTRGLGLGLSIAQRAIALLGGKIICRSRVGHGSVFDFFLPLANVANKTLPQHSASTHTQNSAIDKDAFVRGKRFVVVEDDKLVAQALQDLLEYTGGEVTCFDNAEDALQYQDIQKTDYFIADYMLAGELNGIQFLNQLRQRMNKQVKAVLMTGDTSSSFIRHAVDCDWPVLHKPVNVTKLIAALDIS